MVPTRPRCGPWQVPPYNIVKTSTGVRQETLVKLVKILPCEGKVEQIKYLLLLNAFLPQKGKVESILLMVLFLPRQDKVECQTKLFALNHATEPIVENPFVNTCEINSGSEDGNSMDSFYTVGSFIPPIQIMSGLVNSSYGAPSTGTFSAYGNPAPNQINHE